MVMVWGCFGSVVVVVCWPCGVVEWWWCGVGAGGSGIVMVRRCGQGVKILTENLTSKF